MKKNIIKIVFAVFLVGLFYLSTHPVNIMGLDVLSYIFGFVAASIIRNATDVVDNFYNKSFYRLRVEDTEYVVEIQKGKVVNFVSQPIKSKGE